MAVRKIKNSWWADFRINHTRYRKRSPENSKAGAEAYESVLRAKLARGESIDKALPVKRYGFEQFARQWFDEYVVPNNRHAEQRNKKYVLFNSLTPFFGKMHLEEITSHHVERYKAQKVKEGLTNKTIRNHLSVFHKCLVTAYEWLPLESKLPNIKWPKCKPPKTDYLSFEECERIISSSHGLSYELVLMALRTGMRQGELKGLQWQSIDWLNRLIIVRHSQCDYSKSLNSPKNNRERHIPLDDELYELLSRRKKSQGYVFVDWDGKTFNYHRLKVMIREVCEEARLRRIGWHTLRHTFASHLVMRGVPLPVVQQLLGHSSITMTMRYSHLAPSLMREAIDILGSNSVRRGNFGQPVGNRHERSVEEIPRNA